MINNLFVSISLITYNQKDYIVDAIESVLKQETNFKFELVIGDDFSTDGTREICQYYGMRYPDIIKLRLPSKNLGFIANMRENLQACKGTFVALLEGDDYWIDSTKLQKQVDYLNNNIECGLICTDYKVLDCSSNSEALSSEFYKTPKLEEGFDYTVKDLIKHNFVGPLTAVFRRDNLDFSRILKDDYKTGDYPIWLEIASKYTIHYLDLCTAVYRYIPDSLSHKLNAYEAFKFGMSVEDIRFKYANIYGLTDIVEVEYLSLKKFQLDYAFENKDKSFFISAFNSLSNLTPEYVTLSKKIRRTIVSYPIIVKMYLWLKVQKNKFLYNK